MVGDTVVHGFLWENGMMRDLNTLIDPNEGWRISKPNDVNDVGQIVALASRDTEPWAHAVLLTPAPEPAIFALIGFIPFARPARSRVRTTTEPSVVR